MPVIMQTVFNIQCDQCGEDVHVTMSTPVQVASEKSSIEVFIRECYYLEDGIVVGHDVIFKGDWDNEDLR